MINSARIKNRDVMIMGAIIGAVVGLVIFLIQQQQKKKQEGDVLDSSLNESEKDA